MDFTPVDNSSENETHVNDVPGPDSLSAGAEKPSLTCTSYSNLQHAVDKSMKRIASKSRVLPYIKEHFRAVYRADSKNVLELYKSMMNQLESMIKEEIQMQLDANGVEALLDNLDTIKRDSTSVQRSWRPSGDPAEDLKAHLQETSQMELQQLEKILCTLESHNKLLNECVIKSDEKLRQSLKLIEEHCSAYDKAALVMSDETRQEFLEANMNQARLQQKESQE